MKKFIYYALLLTMTSLIHAGPVGQEGDVTGKPINTLTTFQDIRNLFKGLFWMTYEINSKIGSYKNSSELITLKPQNIVQKLEEVQAVLLTWDKLYFSLIDQLLAADPDTLKEIRRQINNCSTLANIERAFKVLPNDLPAIPVHIFASPESKKLFPTGKLDESTFDRKNEIHKNGIKKFTNEFRKNRDEIEQAFEESALDILGLNKKEDR